MAKPDRSWDFLPPTPADDGVDPEFEALVAAYPRGSVGALPKARIRWDELRKVDRKAALKRLPRVLRGRKDNGHRPLSLVTYLINRDWERFPPPGKADDQDVTPVEFKPYVGPLWALLWGVIDPAGKDHGPSKRVEYFLSRIDKGLVTPANALPKSEDTTSLIPVKIGSDDHAAWVAHCEKLGVRLPRPDVVPVVFVPSERPPVLKATWKGYRLAVPQRLMFRSTAWWWRFHKIEDGTIIEAQLREGGRSQGSILVDMGPWPSSGELASMVEVSRLSDQWRAWAMWFDTKGVYLDLWSESSIWCPSEYPPLSVASTKELAT